MRRRGRGLRRGSIARARRAFDARDDADHLPVAIVSESVARQLWPGASRVGKRVRRRDPTLPVIEVVGVAADVRHRNRYSLDDLAVGLPPGGGAALALAGLALGTLGALAAGRAMAALLVDVDRFDRPTFAVVAATLLALALAASYRPAFGVLRRGAIQGLREE